MHQGSVGYLLNLFRGVDSSLARIVSNLHISNILLAIQLSQMHEVLMTAVVILAFTEGLQWEEA